MDRSTPSSSLSLTEVNPRFVAPVSFKVDVQNTPQKDLISGKGTLKPDNSACTPFPVKKAGITIRY
jgi:hypothetical protein